MSDYVDVLNEAAHKKSVLLEAREYLNNPPKDGNYGLYINVTWGSGTSSSGRAVLLQKVKQYIENNFLDLLNRALKEIEVEENSARLDAYSILKETIEREVK